MNYGFWLLPPNLFIHIIISIPLKMKLLSFSLFTKIPKNDGKKLLIHLLMNI